MSLARSRWAAVGAAVAVSVGAGSLLPASASIGSGERSTFVPITPCRLFDTRPAPDTVGARSTPLGPTDTHTVLVWGTNGNCTIPSDATGVVMNVAAIAPSDDSFLTVFPAGAPRPLAANLNWEAGDPPVSNAATADVAADGRISFFNLKGSVHVAADIVGYYVDHHHDDRYYTKTQSDSALAAKAAKPTGAGTSIVDAAMFMPLTSSGMSFSYDVNGNLESVTGGCFRAPVLLPHGATVTSVTLHAFDSTTGVETAILLYRNPVGSVGTSEMASVGGPNGDPNADVTVVDSSIQFPVIDNNGFTYTALTCINPQSEGAYRFHDMVVAFTHPA